MSEQSIVYFAEAGGAVKIGHTSRLQMRIADMQVSQHCAINLLATVPGGQDLEQHLHETFAKDRVRGEWFVLSDDILDLIQKVKIMGVEAIPAGFEPQRRSSQDVSEISVELVRELVSQALHDTSEDRKHAAKRIGADTNSDPRAVENWLQGVNAPSVTKFLRMMVLYPAVRDAVLTATDPCESDDDDLDLLKTWCQRLHARPGLTPMARKKISLIKQILALSEALDDA